MNKKYLVWSAITSIILMIIAFILMVSASRLPHSILIDQAERRISKVQNGADMIKKELLLDCYRKHLNFENALREKELAYVELVKILSSAFIFIALVQLFLIYKLKEKN